MARFVTTLRFTDRGIQAVQDTCRRATAFKAAGRKLGIKVSQLYWTLGAYDGVIVFEAPDDETATAAMLQLSSQGNVQTQTVRAFDAAEMQGIVDRLAAGS
jgi:uncharacterized protein with GYD domain